MKPLSASELALWRKDKDAHYKRYVLGETEPANDKMKLGTLVHAAIEDEKFPWLEIMTKENYDPAIIKAVRKIMDKADRLRAPEREVGMRATTKSGIPLLAIFDGFNKKERELDEYKTTDNKFRWNQQRVDVNFQLSFYAYVYNLNFYAFFSEIRLHQLNVATGSVRTFRTVRSRADIDIMDRLVHHAVAEMKTAGVWEKRLSKHDRQNQDQLTTGI